MAFEEDDVEEYNHIYEEMKRLMQTDGIRSMNLYTEVNYHIINGDYKQALLLVDRLSADTCAERKAVIYHRLGDNEKAYEYMVQYKHISDSISRVSHDNSMASLYLRMNNDRLRLEQELLAHQNSQLRYRFYIAVAVVLILLLLFMIYQRRKLIKLLKRDNTMLDYGKKGAERALKDLNELSFYENKTDLPLTIPVKVNKLCDHLATVTQNHCNKSVTTVFQTDFSDDFEIMTNPDALEKLLSHLLNSSSNFTRKGTILLKCADAGERVMFIVTDTSKVLADKLKGRSSEMADETEDTARYISMNFNICQSISRLLLGRLWRDVEYTDGTRFCFEIPKS
jgi:signal transduction histidine kinase